ncbi:MAG TPA: hypothetical protein VKU44_00730 [Terriglobia bacterium]|nr:hypothetical protein [Terriglobia bacterium]
MKWSKCVPAVLLLAGALPLAAKEEHKKPSGEIPDRAAFAKIQSYCIDSCELSDAEAYDVRGFVESESKAKGLLTKLPWKLEPDCRESDPDAVIKVDFPRLRDIDVQLGEPPDPRDQPDPGDYHTVAVLNISDPDSGRLLYKVQAMPLDNPFLDPGVERGDSPHLQRHNALYNAFGTLIADAKRVSQAAKDKGKDTNKK